MSPWLMRIFEFVNGGPEASTAEAVLRGALVGCSLFAMVQWLTMLGTRWGNRNAMTKAFFLSVLIHFCLGLGGAIFEEHQRQTFVAAAPVSEEPRVRVREVRLDQPASVERQKSADAPVWEQGPILSEEPFVRRRVPTKKPTPDEVLPPVPFRKDEISPPLKLPEVATDEALPIQPERSEPIDRTKTQKAMGPEVAVAESVPAARPDSIPFARPSRRTERRNPTAEEPIADVERSRPRSSTERPVEAMALPPTAGGSPLPADTPPTREKRPPALANRVADETGTQRAKPEGPPVEKAPDGPVIRGTVRGVVTDSVTGAPLPSAVIRFDLPQGEPLTAVTAENGTYELKIATIAENAAISATRNGYLPESHNLRASDLRRQKARIDFAMRPANESVIAVEGDPVVHHLGNDRFDNRGAGEINSQFQRKSEGTAFVTTFRVSRAQMRQKKARAVLTMMVRGVQCQPDIRINGTLIPKRSEKSPPDGSFGSLALPFDPILLREGDNEIRVESVNCNGDLDDFEFVNPQVRLTRPE